MSVLLHFQWVWLQRNLRKPTLVTDNLDNILYCIHFSMSGESQTQKYLQQFYLMSTKDNSENFGESHHCKNL